MPRVFFSYCHADEKLRDQLEVQLSMLKRQGVIETWHDRRIGAGQDFANEIDDHVNSDEIVLLLVSPDFIASNYCYEIEMRRAMERHELGEAVVIPVILRPCEWTQAPFGKLNAVPRDGVPVTRSVDIDEALLQVARAVRDAANRWNGNAPAGTAATARAAPVGAPTSTQGPRSSNLRLTKTFSQRDKDRFRDETFEYIARFFENSLRELGDRNDGVEGVFRRVDANRFFATIYRNGKDVARVTIFMGGSFGNGINYVQGHSTESNSSNGWMDVGADDQTLFLTSLFSMGQDRDRKLSQEGAAEELWSALIEPLQQSRY